MLRISGIFCFTLLLAGAAGAQSLTGTWQIGTENWAKCRAVVDSGTRSTAEYALGPLQMTQSGTALYLQTARGTLRYQGSAYPGTAQATSCAAVTGNALDVPGTFFFSKSDPAKGQLQGLFVGRWQNSGDLLVCKLKAVRTSAANPAIAACP
jgi:hypothetical protein